MEIDQHIQILDFSDKTTRSPFRTHFPPGIMSEEAYSELREYLHYANNNHPETAAPHAEAFAKIMGFPIDDLLLRADQLEKEANESRLLQGFEKTDEKLRAG